MIRDMLQWITWVFAGPERKWSTTAGVMTEMGHTPKPVGVPTRHLACTQCGRTGFVRGRNIFGLATRYRCDEEY